jgi:IS4 transposase
MDDSRTPYPGILRGYEIYIQRWQIELLWKFLKMHLKLDRLMTKNENGIRIQIMCCLIAYLILQLIEIPREFGKILLDPTFRRCFLIFRNYP